MASTALVHAGAGFDGGAGEAAAIGEGLDGAGAGIPQGAVEALRAGAAGGFLGIEQLDRRAEAVALPEAIAQVVEAGGGMGEVEGAGAGGFAVDTLAVDDVEDGGGPCGEGGHQAHAVGFAGMGDDVVGRRPEAGIDQPDIAARTAMADRVGLEHRHRGAAPCRVERGGAAGEPAADDREVCLAIAVEAGARHGFPGAGPPQVCLGVRGQGGSLRRKEDAPGF